MFFKSLAPSKINNTENFKIPPQLFRSVLGAFRTRIKCFSSPRDVKDRSRAEVTQGKEGKEKGLLHVREVGQGAERIQTEMLTTPVACSHNGAVHRCHAEGKGLISAFSHEGLRWEGGHLKRDSHIRSLGGEDSFFFWSSNQTLVSALNGTMILFHMVEKVAEGLLRGKTRA